MGDDKEKLASLSNYWPITATVRQQRICAMWRTMFPGAKHVEILFVFRPPDSAVDGYRYTASLRVSDAQGASTEYAADNECHGPEIESAAAALEQHVIGLLNKRVQGAKESLLEAENKWREVMTLCRQGV